MTTEDATLPGASEEALHQQDSVGAPIETDDLPVEERISAKLAARRVQEPAAIDPDTDPDDDAGHPDGDAAAATGAGDGADGGTQQPEARPAAADDLDMTRLVRVKVDGVERDVPLADVLKGYQIEAAARQRLEQATRLMREAEARVGGSAGGGPAGAGQGNGGATQPGAPQTQGQQPAGPDPAAALLEAFDSGDAAKVTEALKTFMGAQQGGQQAGQHATPEEVQRVVQATIAEGRVKSADEREFAAWANQNADIAKVDDLSEAVGRRVQAGMVDDLIEAGAHPDAVRRLSPAELGTYHRRARLLGHGRPMHELLRTSTEAVRTNVGATRQGAPAIPATTTAQKTDAKRKAAAATAKPASARAPAPSKPQGRPSVGDYVAEERRARGLD